MSEQFRSVDRETGYLFPPSVQEWLPEGHLARFVVDIVDRVDVSELTGGYGGGGKAPHHPGMLLGLLFYGYATGVFSSRKLEQATYDSVAVRYLSGDQHPDHDTIAHFRKRFMKELGGLFGQILMIAWEMGVLRVGRVSLDGTKVKGNASKHKATSWRYANRLEAQLRGEIAEWFERAERADAEEEGEVELPEELKRREDRLAAIGRAQEEIKRRARERDVSERAEYEAKLTRQRAKEAATGKKAGSLRRRKS